MKADFYTGSLVPPEDLWFRQPFIDQLWEKIRNEHVLLTAPRRTAKSNQIASTLSDFSKGQRLVSLSEHLGYCCWSYRSLV